jgi:hypothetical protein
MAQAGFSSLASEQALTVRLVSYAAGELDKAIRRDAEKRPALF